jgi:hypothetical protein
VSTAAFEAETAATAVAIVAVAVSLAAVACATSVVAVAIAVSTACCAGLTTTCYAGAGGSFAYACPGARIAIINASIGAPKRLTRSFLAASLLFTLTMRLRNRKYPHHRLIPHSNCCIYMLILHYQYLETT